MPSPLRRPDLLALQTLIDAHASRGTFAGSVLVRRGSDLLVRTAAGQADRELDRPNRPDTDFRIGSIAKTFSALAVLRLAERNALSVGDPIGRWVPDFPDADRILLHHLLSNTSGVPDYLTLPELQPRIAEPHELVEIVDYVRGRPLLFEPGQRLSYSNTNWTLLALAVERAAGRPFAAALGDLVIGPLGLERTFVDLDRADPRSARGYFLTDDGVEPAPPIHPTVELGAGGMRSTVDDLLGLDRALSRPGWLGPEPLAAMTRPVASDGPIGYGYAIVWTTRFGRACHGHSGGTFGFTAFWSRYPAEDATVIVLANLDNGSAERLERDLAAALFGEPYELPGDRAFVSLEPGELEPFAGRYRSSFAGRAIDFTIDLAGDRLYAVFPLLPRAALRPLSATRFFTRMKGGDVTFEFVREGGRVTRIAVDWSGNPMECPRLP